MSIRRQCHHSLNFKAKIHLKYLQILLPHQHIFAAEERQRDAKISSNSQKPRKQSKKSTSLKLQEHLITQLFSKAAQINYTVGHDPYICKIRLHIYHHSSHKHPRNNCQHTPPCVIDSSMVNQQQMTYQTNQWLNADITDGLHATLRQYNVYTHA
jgi:hypothetical protein